jgi:hypothetical protein
MLKQFVAAFMLLTFMGQTFSNAIIVADYYINTASFAANCENKDKPQIHCNGQCQMSKQLEKENKKDQSNPDRKSENKIEAISSKSFYGEISLESRTNKNQYSLCYNTGKPIHRSATIFHPPCAA